MTSPVLRETLKAKIDYVTDEAQLKALSVMLDTMMVAGSQFDLLPNGRAVSDEDIARWREAADDVLVHGNGIPHEEVKAMFQLS